MLSSASIPPIIRPLSCCGKRPCGTMVKSRILSPIVRKSVISTGKGCSSACRNVRAYRLLSPSIAAVPARAKRPIGCPDARWRRKSEHIMGVVVRANSSETPLAIERTIANSRKSRPTRSPSSKMGRNIATNETLIETTVKLTSRAPVSAASIREAPASRCPGCNGSGLVGPPARLDFHG